MGPDARLTPGELCSTPTAHRYPEQINYCERDVVYEMKMEVFDLYRAAGYKLNPGDRNKYKIDHYIPLCAGGANTVENLWPQHYSIYAITDSIEELACAKLKLGKLTQAKTVEILKKVKNNLSLAPEVTKTLQAIR